MAVAAEGTADLQKQHATLLAKAQALLEEAAEAAAAMRAIETADMETREVAPGEKQAPNANSDATERQREGADDSGKSEHPGEVVQKPGLWPDRVDDWLSNVSRFHQGARTSADIAAYADRLGDTAGLTLDAARERSLEALVEAQERELVTLQAAEALERAALRRDEVMLASLAEELSTLEAFLRGEGHPTTTSYHTEEDSSASDAGQRLLQRLADQENKLLQQTKQESEQLRAAMVETGEHIARCEREASLLSDARVAAKALLTADPESLRAQLESLKKALLSVQNDIDVLRAGGHEVSNRSMEVAEELSFAEAEVEAESTVRDFARQRIDVASKAASEQQAIYRLLGVTGSAGISSILS